MNSTLYDMIKKYDFEEIRETFTECYTDDNLRNIDGFEIVFNNLKNSKEIITNDFLIKLTEFSDHTGVSGVKDSDQETTWSLSLTPWKEWLGMNILPETILDYSDKEIICRCIWEMTYFGYNEDKTKAFANSILKDIEEDNFETMEGFLDELDDIDSEEELKDYLRDLLKDEISSSSSDEEIF